MKLSRMSRGALLAVACLCGCASVGLRSPKTSVIVGRVFADGDTGGVEGVRVAVAGTKIEVTTRKDGSFALRHRLHGLNVITLARSGHDSTQLPALNLTSRDTIHFRAMLQDSASLPPLPVREPNICMVVECNPLPWRLGTEPILVIDGVISNLGDDPSLGADNKASALNNSIARISVVTGKQAIDLYGQHARKGVVIVTTRRDGTPAVRRQ